MDMVAIIGGTGVYDPDIMENTENRVITTSYGETRVMVGQYKGRTIAFMPRHGGDHSVPPHLINYRANIEALYKLGVKRIIATAAVGSLNFEYKPGSIVVVDQFIDFTKSRIPTFFAGDERGVVHVDMTEPYCPEMRQVLFEVASTTDTDVFERGTYVCTEGPRFETAAEIKMFKVLGGDVIGMTTVPEAVLARELGICYSTVAMVTNYAAGISTGKLTHAEVVACMKANLVRLRETITRAIEKIPSPPGCDCGMVPDGIRVK
ncbi:MAG: S-methyl-5'-thioadenosine phosphorylase [Syntrophomonadales bacterium]|jgi:5'-methylthioadenosine phosphorylase